jgi:hypothetical protein
MRVDVGEPLELLWSLRAAACSQPDFFEPAEQAANAQLRGSQNAHYQADPDGTGTSSSHTCGATMGCRSTS